MTDDDGMRLGELEGVVAEEDGYTAESDAAMLLRAWVSRGRSTTQDGEIPGRPEVPRPARPGALRQAPGSAPRRAYQLPRSRLHPLARDFLGRYEGTLSSSPTTATSSTPSAPTSPTSTTRRSSPTPAATTTWCWPRPRSARGWSRRTPRAKRRSPSSTNSSRASPLEPARPRSPAARRKWNGYKPPSSPAPTSRARISASIRTGRPASTFSKSKACARLTAT